jgi:hypothetical protein
MRRQIALEFEYEELEQQKLSALNSKKVITTKKININRNSTKSNIKIKFN